MDRITLLSTYSVRHSPAPSAERPAAPPAALRRGFARPGRRFAPGVVPSPAPSIPPRTSPLPRLAAARAGGQRRRRARCDIPRRLRGRAAADGLAVVGFAAARVRLPRPRRPTAARGPNSPNALARARRVQPRTGAQGKRFAARPSAFGGFRRIQSRCAGAPRAPARQHFLLHRPPC